MSEEDLSLPVPLVIFTVTRYFSTDDLRFKQCMSTISFPSPYHLVIVDGSPSEEVHSALQNTRAIVHRETQQGGKGVQLRQACQIASELPGVTEDTLLCFQEPEKTSMVDCWESVFAHGESADVVIPYRSHYCFQKSYPIEQYHSENFGNFYLDAAMNEALKNDKEAKAPDLTHSSLVREIEKSTSKIPSIDWHFGPFAFKAKHIQLWTAYNGNSYDAQLVPIVHAMRKGLTLSSVCVDFELDQSMKEQEEGNVEFIEKRLYQLNILDSKVKSAWTEELS